MKLLIVSDLHIGAEDRNIFGWNSNQFTDQLLKLKLIHKIDKIILNGDIFDLYRQPIEKISNEHPEFLKFTESKNVVYIRGNHDFLYSSAKESYLTVNSKGKKIYIEHGHNADFLNGTAAGRLVARITFRFINLMYKYQIVKNIVHRAVEYSDQIHTIPRKYDRYKYLNYALRLLRTYDMVILGHTHKPEILKTWFLNQKKIYANSGTCSLGRFQALIADCEKLTVRVIKYSLKHRQDADLKKTSRKLKPKSIVV
jgi:predicted phosphodiesterase